MSAPGNRAHSSQPERYQQQQQGHPTVMSLQREISTALDAAASPSSRVASLSKLHAVMAAHQAQRPAVAVALLPWFLSSWPQLVSCLWDSTVPQLPAAVAPLLGLIGSLVASSSAAAAAAAAEDSATKPDDEHPLVQEMLEAVSTPPTLLGPLLQVLLEVLRMDVGVVTGVVLRDLLDLLLGWSLEPNLSNSDRQLVTRVLYACKPCWLAEPQLVLDVGSKLQADLQQLMMSLTPSAADQVLDHHADDGAMQAAAVTGVDAPTDQQGSKDQEQQKFLALLSCLVAILRAAAGMLAIQELLEHTAQLMISAHQKYIRQGIPNADSCHVAAQLSCLMLALWQSNAAAVIAAASATSSTGIADNGRTIEIPDPAARSLSEVDVLVSSKTGWQSLDEGAAATPGACSSRSNNNSQSTELAALAGLLAAAYQTVKMKLLLAEDGVAVLASLSQAVSSIGVYLLQEQTSQQRGAGGTLALTEAVLEQLLGMPLEQAVGQVFAETLCARDASSGDTASSRDGSGDEQQQMQGPPQEMTDRCQEQQPEQQQTPTLGATKSETEETLGQQAAPDEGQSAGKDGSATASEVRQSVEPASVCELDSLQQMERQQVGMQHRPEPAVAALQHQGQLLQSLGLACLQLLVLTPGVGLSTRCEAVAMLPDALLGMALDCGNGGSEAAGGTVGAAAWNATATAAAITAWHAVLELLEAARASDDAVVRAVAVSCAGRLAMGLWHNEFGQLALGSSATAAATHLPFAYFMWLVRLLVDSSSDLDVQVAAAARFGSRRTLSFEGLHTGAATSWLLLQEASRQCVNARMRTHMGNPAQSFTTLEKLESFRVVWKATGKLYALDILAADASCAAEEEQQENTHEGDELTTGAAANSGDLGAGGAGGTGHASKTGQTAAGGECTSAGTLFLSWLSAAAAHAEGCYEAALQQYRQYNSVVAAAGLPSTPLGQPLQEFVLGQMAACYAALGDWKGLATVDNGSSASDGHFRSLATKQQQQQQRCAQLWVFAGSAGITELQQWQDIPKGTNQQQQSQQQMPAKAGRAKGRRGLGDPGARWSMEQEEQLVMLDPTNCCIPGWLASWLRGLACRSTEQQGRSSDCVAEGAAGGAHAAEGVWADALLPDGQLGSSCFWNVSTVMPLLQESRALKLSWGLDSGKSDSPAAAVAPAQLAAAYLSLATLLHPGSGARPVPTDSKGLGVQLKLVQVMKQHGEQLQEQLQRALHCCPVAAWQVRSAQEAGSKALEGLTVTAREATAALLTELGLEVNRKLLALQADAVRQGRQQGLSRQRLSQVITNRYHTMMAPVVGALEQHITTAATSPSASPDEAAFKQQMLPALQQLLDDLRQPPVELLQAIQQQQDDAAASGGREAGGVSRATSAAARGSFAPLKQLQQDLANQLRQHAQLKLHSVAPLLGQLKDTAIPLPADDATVAALPPLTLGQALQSWQSSSTHLPEGRQQCELPAAAGAMALSDGTTADSSSWLCIAAFDPTVLVLPTKTRPKRLRLLASDGSAHTFLLKGRDDLRVDERVMQFMRAANTLLAPAATCSAGPAPGAQEREGAAGLWHMPSKQLLKVRSYSITPFGRRAGLVQWVRHTTSLFGLVRSWQSATAERYDALAAAKRDAAGAGSGTAEASSAADASAGAAADSGKEKGGVLLPLMVAAARPADAFYARLLPALQAAGVAVGAPRHSWPAGVLRSTFLSLCRDAPRALLAKQLLTAAADPGAWWSSCQVFTASAAVGSILGWVLGLGDRHLDNLLLDTDTGELLHIDFSVCFDKGQGLGVPEVVPFRLTQMMQAALGPGGLPGPFTAAACQALLRLRGSSELLCGLLELLLKDPAVDWSAEREVHAARKDQDTSVSLKLFASRMEELRQPLLSSLAAALPIIGNGLAAVVSYGAAHIYMAQLQAAADAARQGAAAAQAALADATQSEVTALTSGSAASQKVTALSSDYRRLCGLAAGCLNSAGNWLSRHQQTLGVLYGSGQLQEAFTDVEVLTPAESHWDGARCDRDLLLLSSNASISDSSQPSGDVSAAEAEGSVQGPRCILTQSLGPLLPCINAAGSKGSRITDLLPAEVVQQCGDVDSQGQQLLRDMASMVMVGRWSVAAYAALLRGLLPVLWPVAAAAFDASQQLHSRDIGSAANCLLDSLASMQAVLQEYERAGLAYMVDLSSSQMTDELPEAAAGMDQLLEQLAGDEGGQAEQQLLALRQQQESGAWQQQHQWLVAAAGHLQLVQQLLSAAATSVASGAVMHTKDVFEALSAQSSAAAAAVPGIGTSSTDNMSAGGAEVCWGTADLAGAWKSLVVLLLQWGCMVQQQQQLRQDLSSGVDGRAGSHGAASEGIDPVVGSGGVVDVLHDGSTLPLDLERYKPLVLVIQTLDQLLLLPLHLPEEGGTTAGATPGHHATCLATQLQLMLLPAVAKPLLQQLQQGLLQLQQHLHVLAAEAQQVLSRHCQHPQRPVGRHDSSGLTQQHGDSADSQQQQGTEALSAHDWDTSSSGGGSDAALASCLQDLVPFDAFDASLPGADMALEDEEALLLGAEEMLYQDADADRDDEDCCGLVINNDGGDDDDDDDAWLAAAAAGEEDSSRAVSEGGDGLGLPALPQLVPFSDFDFTLPGEGAALEDEGPSLEDQDASNGALEGIGAQPGSTLQLYSRQHGLFLLLPELPDAASIPQLAAELSNCLTGGSSSSGGGGDVMPSRDQLLAAWQWVADQAGGMEGRLAVLSGLLARCQHWCAGAAGVLSSLATVGEAALQLEYSRQGRLWAPGVAGGVDAFQGNASLLSQLKDTAAALADAHVQVATAEALLLSSQAAAQQAELLMDESAAEAAAAEQEMVLKTPAALARASAMQPVIAPMLQAAESVLPIVNQGLGSTLKVLAGLEDLQELGQAHILFTQLTHQLDALAAAAETVATAITAEHALVGPSSKPAAAAASGGSVDVEPGASTTAGLTARQQRAEARQRAFTAAAYARCSSRLTGARPAKGSSGGGKAAAAGAIESDASGSSSSRASMTVPQEVARLVAAATSTDNLSRMYEGWAAWI
eukprot:gene8457-8641_t